jgi:5-methylcytosine-specific restriction endonuclease McrA
MTDLKNLTDDELVASFRDLVITEPEEETNKLKHMVELERRKLFSGKSSLRSYVIDEFNMDETCAERRVRAVRLMLRFPALEELLRFGKLNLTLLDLAQVCANREELTEAELWELLLGIAGMTTRRAKREIACRYPLIANLPHDCIRPLNEELSELRCVVKNSVVDTLEEIRGLLAHANPRISLGEMIETLANEYRARHHPEAKAERAAEREEKKSKKVETPPAQEPPAESVPPKWTESRYFSQAVLYALIRRDGYRCSYVDPKTGQRCLSSHKLEADHIIAWADGGKSELSNARLLCIGHHRRVSFLRFGEASRYFRTKRELEPRPICT